MTTITELQELADTLCIPYTKDEFNYLANNPKRAKYVAALMKGVINSRRKQLVAITEKTKHHIGIAKRETLRLDNANEVLSRVNNGDTYEKIGKDLGFTRQNVSHIVNKYQDK
jgi:hypothetical protein